MRGPHGLTQITSTVRSLDTVHEMAARRWKRTNGMIGTNGIRETEIVNKSGIATGAVLLSFTTSMYGGLGTMLHQLHVIKFISAFDATKQVSTVRPFPNGTTNTVQEGGLVVPSRSKPVNVVVRNCLYLVSSTAGGIGQRKILKEFKGDIVSIAVRWMNAS